MPDEKTNTCERKLFSMDLLLKTFTAVAPKAGDLTQGKVIEQKGSSLFVDLGPFGVGIIYGREFINARDIIRTLKP